MSTALVAGLLGLVGTVLGAGLTTWTTRQTAARSERRTWLEARRQEFLSAVAQFASALLNYRLAEADRWLARHGDRKDEAAASQEAYKRRAAMLDAIYVLELSSDDKQLRQLARDALDLAHDITTAHTQGQMEARVHEARNALEKVVARARVIEPGLPPAGEPEN